MTIIIFILVLAVLVLIHEFGHFIAAKKNGVRVDEFGLGFPPKLFGYKFRGTEYTINLIPLGGFVRIKGEGGEHKNEHDSFGNKKVWQRLLIVSAGVIMNMIAAWVFLSIALTLGVTVDLDQQELIPEARVQNMRVMVESILPKSPAAQMNLEPGDVIEAINKEKLEEVADIQSYVNANGAKPLDVVVRRKEKVLVLSGTPEFIQSLNRYALGIGLVKTGVVSLPPQLAVIEGAKKTGYITQEIVKAFYRIMSDVLSGVKPESELSGPVAIAVVTGQVAKLGFTHILQFMAILSVNLAIINFLPLPAMDGGRALFLLIEKIRGRPVSRNLESLVHSIGFTVLIILMIFVTIGDIGKYGGEIMKSLNRL